MLSHGTESKVVDSIIEAALKDENTIISDKKAAEKKLSLDEAGKAIMKKLFDLGLNQILGGVNIKKIISQDEKFHTLKKVKIDPKLTGPLSPVFKSIELEVKVGYANGLAAIWLDYSWQHTRGSNGYDIRLVTNDGKTWE